MMTTLWHGTWPLLPTWVSNVIEMSVGEEGHNHQEKYFQFYENKRWLTAQTVPLCVELPKDFHFLLNSKPKNVAMPILQRQFFLLNSIYCQFFVRSRRGNMDSAENGFQWENEDTPQDSTALEIWEQRKAGNLVNLENPPIVLLSSHINCMIAKKEEGIECFALKMKIEYVHNHEIQTTKAWSFLGVSKETVERYFQLFQDSYTPSKARLVYIA